MKSKFFLVILALLGLSSTAWSLVFDAAPFALPLREGNGLQWEDPREIHQVTVHFTGPVPAEGVRLEYWGSRWPQQHLPKDREPGGGDVGWMELGNWYQGGWRVADSQASRQGNSVTFTFRPVNAKEFPDQKDYPAAFRYTLKIRVASERPLPGIQRFEVLTDSQVVEKAAQITWKKSSTGKPDIQVHNGAFITTEKAGKGRQTVKLGAVENKDPNTFDRTLVTVKNGKQVFTFAFDDLKQGPLYLPEFGAAVLTEGDARDYAAVEADVKAKGAKTLYDQVAERPEQTWQSAWNGVPRKKSHIYFPLGLDGGRQRFQLNADGSIRFRSNDHYLRSRPGKDTPRLDLEPAEVSFRFGDYGEPAARGIDEDSLPVCTSTWEKGGLQITQTAFVTSLSGTHGEDPVPPADAFAVFIARFTFKNTSSSTQTAVLPVTYRSGDKDQALRTDTDGLVWLGENLRGQVVVDSSEKVEHDGLNWKWTLAPGESRSVVLKVPYVVLNDPLEHAALRKLDFETERLAVNGYWRKRLNESARLITPEPVLDQFYRSHGRHLLVNCEREPDSTRRFARVGSFSYGAYGNESCMMVVDLDRRGYHREAQECLDAWLHYQGTVKLPGDFQTQIGVLYGAGGYESGGYNQHHGWILWCLAEHYRFTRDEPWLRSAAPGILAGADWIIRETQRTMDRHPLERGLLPAGSLEDIGDWWTWLSTSCYTWRGLDSAAWALEQLQHPQARRIRQEANAYHQTLLANFREAAQLSPVVRLRDGTAVPHIPSYVHRRGRSFGWICETLEGALHLLITGALDPRSPEARWIVNDYEDNLYLSNQYGYTLDNFEEHWFGRGGMSMQACLLLDVEPYLYRDDIKQALRSMFNGIAVSHFPDVHMNTEHALPDMADWRGDQFKSSDEANANGWLRYLFVRESGDTLLIGQGIPREWLGPGKRCGMDRAATYFGPVTIVYTGDENQITARLDGPTRNAPRQIRLRFRAPEDRTISYVTVNGKHWTRVTKDWIELPGDIGSVEIIARLGR